MSIYKPKYCTYLTVYLGSKLPMYYIGSGVISKLEKGYSGSIRSIEYKQIYQIEKLNNPHLFKTKIICKYHSRKMAFYKEKQLHIKLNVVKSNMYMNKSIARSFGWEGMNVKGSASPVYGKRWKKTKEQIENSVKALSRTFSSMEYRAKLSKMRTGKLPKSRKQIAEDRKIYKQILSLYDSKPELENGYVTRNGKILTYDRAFANKFYSNFNLSSAGLYWIIKNRGSKLNRVN